MLDELKELQTNLKAKYRAKLWKRYCEQEAYNRVSRYGFTRKSKEYYQTVVDVMQEFKYIPLEQIKQSLGGR